ncbi:class I SAM-dependent methyltransferase [Leptospira ilyithenensis]|uniref:Class I SAM-dependent methyltransferase n=1 Tax=Leptospira ilyithenensis TaxID=2484901 RepID=A0A4R9LMV9_9LEPT|nr:class I SAM-dependent methyltransferase [Leptospira ilyithenensis]TGN08037.1 class I SAM-dependent methyltransferase [Leptospira ilyithenensis]
MSDAYINWKNSLKTNNGIFLISEDRRFTHDESEYEADMDFSTLTHGYGVIQLMKSLGCDINGPAIEIGAGNGLISVSLAEAHGFSDFMVTDASSVFVEICRNNVEKYAKTKSNVSYGIFNGDDLKDLPDNVYSLVCMANALHHIEYFEEFVTLVSAKLKIGGAFVCQEPISDGFLMLGVLAKAYLVFSKKLSKRLIEKLEELSLTMSNSNRRDMNKSHLEDKHIFNIYELQQLASKTGMRLLVYPNMGLEAFADGLNETKSKQESFSEMSKGYIQHCLNWDQDLKDEVFSKFDELFKFIDIACGGGYYPPVSGSFCMVKER